MTRISPVGNKSLAEVENCSVVPAQLLGQDLWQLLPACVQVQRRQGVGLPRAGFRQVGEKHRVLGIFRLGRRVCRKVGKRSRRELAERKEAEADGELRAISSDWHMLEACGSSSWESGGRVGAGESAQGCYSVNSGITEVPGRRQVRWR